ncbi:MAG: sugar phosphate isomerase/epimerase [Bacteroidales bacterium]|nr:sugar phosphate isomerase/epimerase [Bacteroidales bacterium]
MKKNNLLFGITIDKFKGVNASELLLIIKKMGLEFVEITISVFDDLLPFIENLGNIQTGFHLPIMHDYDFDFSCKNHDSEIQRIIQMINEHHKDLNINYCLSHPPEGKKSVLSEQETISYLFENLKKLNCPILIENIQTWDKQKFKDFFVQAKEVLGEKLIGQCFDAPHYLLSGENPVEFIYNADGNMQCVHLSDCKENFDAHLPFGLGGILPFDEILKTLKQKKYNGYINLELLPRTSSDLKPLINSYLKVIGTFNHSKYYAAKFRLLFYRSIITKTLKYVF